MTDSCAVFLGYRLTGVQLSVKFLDRRWFALLRPECSDSGVIVLKSPESRRNQPEHARNRGKPVVWDSLPYPTGGSIVDFAPLNGGIKGIPPMSFEEIPRG